MDMTEHDLLLDASPTYDKALAELRDAQDDLARLSDLLAHAFEELVHSFHAIQPAPGAEGPPPDLERFTGRAIVALQCEDMAGQLITHASARIGKALDALRIHAPLPTTGLPGAVWAAGIATCADAVATGPVQQTAMHPGTVEFF